MPLDVTFNTAFRGFHREDVLKYIREQEQRHQIDFQDMKQLLEEAERRADALEQAAQLTPDMQALLEENQALKSQRDTLQEENTLLLKENHALLQKVTSWEPDIQNYGILCRQVGEIELSARGRSSALLEQAHQQEAAVYQQAEEVLRQTEQRYRRAREEAETTLAHLSAELERLRGELFALGQEMEQNESSLSALHVQRPGQEVQA